MWVSGKAAGIYAVAEVVSNPAELSDYADLTVASEISGTRT
jgi:hypothetical protein